MIQLCVVIFVLNLLIICLMTKLELIVLICFHRMILKRTINLLKILLSIKTYIKNYIIIKDIIID